MRDWQATLWPASFGGVPFYIEKTKDRFGKKIVVHEFPNRDDPYIEGLGQKANHFDLNAYLAEDTADIDAATLKAMLLAPGPQMLVLPDEGPVLCMFKDGAWDHERDRLGYVGFNLNFVAVGASSAIASAPMLGQLTLDATASLALAAPSLMIQLTV
jgi:prophage DNA circulation protein